MASVRYKLSEFGLIQCKAFQNSQLGQKIKSFIKNYYDETLQKISFSKKKESMQIVFEILQRQGKSPIQKKWIQLLFIEYLINFCSPSLLKSQFVELLNSVCQKINAESSSKGNSQGNNLFNRWSKKLMNFKQKIMVSDEMNRSLQIKSNNQALFSQIVSQIHVNLWKKLQNFEFFKEISEKYLKNEKIFQSYQDFQTFRHKAWKNINLIKSSFKILSFYKKIEIMQSHLKHMMIATLFVLASSYMKMYPYVIKLIQLNSEGVIQKYQQISVLKSDKQKKRKKVAELSKDLVFIQTENLLKELFQINENMLYLFCGKRHAQFIPINKSQRFFLNTNSQQLDQIFNVIGQVKKANQKRQKSKSFMSLLNDKLDSSVDAVIQRINRKNSSQSITDIDTNMSLDNLPIMKKRGSFLKKQPNQEIQLGNEVNHAKENLELYEQIIENI